jgi:Lrp/AsnC family leucine-responsive transcriptional regulator
LRDAVNIGLLRELQRDPRISMTELARRVGMSPAGVTQRVQRLQEMGVIARFRLEVDPVALGLPVTVFLRVRPYRGRSGEVGDVARAMREVSECYRVTGEESFIIKVHVPRIEDLDPVLDRFLALGQTASSIVISSPVPPRSLPLPEADFLDSSDGTLAS